MLYSKSQLSSWVYNETPSKYTSRETSLDNFPLEDIPVSQNFQKKSAILAPWLGVKVPNMKMDFHT